MRWHKIISIPQRILLTFLRDPKFLILAILAPLIIILVFSVTYKPQVDIIKLAIVDLKDNQIEQINVSNSIQNMLVQNKEKISLFNYESVDKAKKDFKKGKLDGIITFPDNLDESVYIKLSGIPVENPAEIELYIDEADKLKSSIITAALESSIMKLSSSFGIEPAVIFSTKSFYEKTDSIQNSWIAAIIGFSIFALSIIFSISLISSEKANGLLESIISSSMNSFEILTGYFISYLFINIIQIIILLSLYLLFYKGILSISIIFIFIFMFLLSICGSLLGIILSISFSSLIRSFQLAVIIILVSLLISGVFWPISSLPIAGKILSYLFPTSFAIDAIRAISVKNYNFIDTIPQLIIMIVFFILYYILGVALVRKSTE